MVQCLNVFSPFKRIERLFSGPTPKMTFHSKKKYLAKKDKKQLNQRLVQKELRRSDFLITIEEYVGARETPLSTTKR